MSDYDYTDTAAEYVSYAEPETYTELDGAATLSPEVSGTNLDVDEQATPQGPDISALPSELKFGALIGPYGETADSYAEKYNYSTTTDSYIGAQSGREIDPYTGAEKK